MTQMQNVVQPQAQPQPQAQQQQQQMVPPTSIPPEFAPFQQAVQRGEFPYYNKWKILGQVFPSQTMPTGFVWRSTQRGGVLNIRLKIRRQYNNAPSVSYLTLVAWNQAGSNIAGFLQPGMMLAADGEWRENRWRDKQTGQWRSQSQFVIDTNRDGTASLYVLGIMQCVQESNPQQGQQQQFVNQPQQVMAQPQQGGMMQPQTVAPVQVQQLAAQQQAPYAPAPQQPQPQAPQVQPVMQPQANPAPAPMQGGTFAPPIGVGTAPNQDPTCPV